VSQSPTPLGLCWEREKIDWQELHEFDCWLVWTIFIFFVTCQFSQDIGEWPQNQILIPDWTYFHCPESLGEGNQNLLQQTFASKWKFSKKCYLSEN